MFLQKPWKEVSFFNFEITNGIRVPLFIIADATHPLLIWVINPFPVNGRLEDKKAHLYYRLSSELLVVENASIKLTGWWRCFFKQNEADTAKMNSVVATC